MSGTGGTGAGTYSYAFASGAVTAVAAGDFSINEATGEVTFTQDAAYAHASGANPQTADDAYSIDVEITDGDGNTSTVTVNVDITDDGPVASADTGSVVEGATLSVSAGSGVLANDLSGADGFATTTLVGVAAGSDTSSAVSGGVGSGVAGTYGTLTLSADGSYTYLATADAVLSGNETDVFVYTVEDSDGDVSTTTLTISVSNSDLSGSVSGDLSTDDSAVRGGGTEGVASGNLSDTVTVSGGLRNWCWYVQLCVCQWSGHIAAVLPVISALTKQPVR